MTVKCTNTLALKILILQLNMKCNVTERLIQNLVTQICPQGKKEDN